MNSRGSASYWLRLVGPKQEVHLIQTLIKNWWLLAVCGLLDAIFSVMYLFMQDANGSLTLRKYALKGTVVFLGNVALAAGVCRIAAGVWKSTTGKSWLLVLNGLALVALGLIFNGVFGTGIALRTVTGLLAVMAMTMGILELAIARTLRGPVPEKWLLGIAAAASVGFALAILWIQPAPGSHLHFLLFGAYFGFSAICMLGLALLLHRLSHAS